MWPIFIEKLYRKAQRMIQSEQMKAFDLEQESPGFDGEAYGSTPLLLRLPDGSAAGRDGCDLRGSAEGGWDTHGDSHRFNSWPPSIGPSRRLIPT